MMLMMQVCSLYERKNAIALLIFITKEQQNLSSEI